MELELSRWQAIQATLLYHFASLDFLKGMQNAMDELAVHVESILDLAATQGRDRHLKSPRWGSRDTSENWTNNAWPFLKDLQLTTRRQIAERAFEKFNITGFNQFDRARSEFSMNWTTPDEELEVDSLVENVASYARYIDQTLDKYSTTNGWSDFSLTCAWSQFKESFNRIPKYRIRFDVKAKTGTMPPRTGVYVSDSDQNATLQFAWHGSPCGKLLLGSTFNRLGLDALTEVGRADLWIDKGKMLQFARTHKRDRLLTEDPFLEESLQDADLAPSLIARNVDAEVDCAWYYVEVIEGEYEEIDSKVAQAPDAIRVPGGEACPVSGYYFTPAKPGSRAFFAKGTIMPRLDSRYGLAIWQWDLDQA